MRAFDYSPDVKVVEKVLGAPRFDRDRFIDNSVAGVVTGLAWTSVGGDILFIESSLSKGKGKLSVTGNLGKVMKESVTIAMEYLKAHAEIYEIFQKFLINGMFMFMFLKEQHQRMVLQLELLCLLL